MNQRILITTSPLKTEIKLSRGQTPFAKHLSVLFPSPRNRAGGNVRGDLIYPFINNNKEATMIIGGI